MKSNLIPLLGLLCACCAAVPGGQAPLEAACPRPGAWIDPATGAAFDFQGWIGRLAERPAVLLGESHTSVEDHRWQAQVLGALYGRKQDLVIGFESFPRRVQPVLDRWSAGELTRDEFLEQSEWKDVWGFPPSLYMPLFDFARMNRLPMVALNVERMLVARVGREGWDAVPADEREGLGAPAPASAEYAAALSEIRAQHGTGADESAAPDDAAIRRFIEAQLTWDRAMAEAIASARAAHPAATVVAIAGRGHVEYGYGIAHQLRDLGIADAAALIPWPVDRECTEFRSAGGVPVADAVFTVAPEEPEAPEAAPRGPRLGVLLSKDGDAVRIDGVGEGSVAAEAGIEKGDIVREAAGRPVATPGDLAEIIQRQPFGTWLPLVVERDGKRRELVAKFPARPHPPMEGPSPHRKTPAAETP